MLGGVITFDYIYPFFLKTYFKMSAKCAEQSMILTYQIFCVLNPCSLQGPHDSLLPSISKHLEQLTILTDQMIHTLKTQVCMLLYVMIQ